MLVNSISNRALRADLAQEFAGLGYVASDSNPDFCVAYYASTNQKLDVTYWDYGYAWRPRWWSGWGRRWGRGWGGDWGIQSGPAVTQYTEGTVIVDVIDPKTKDLLWRGQGRGGFRQRDAIRAGTQEDRRGARRQVPGRGGQGCAGAVRARLHTQTQP